MKLLAIADIHGERQAARKAVDLARREERQIVLLGDLTDRGPDSAGTLAMLLPAILAGDTIWIRGNHDDKLGRALAGHPVKRTHGLGGTLDEIAAHPERAKLESDIVDGLARARYWHMAGRYLFVHGAFHPDMLTTTGPDDAASPGAWKTARHYALYGQTDGRYTPAGYPVRLYDWVDDIPDGLTVVVGHDVRATDTPLIQAGRQGGRAIFLDTGAGKGGRLSAIRLDEEDVVQFDCVTREGQASPSPLA